MEDKLNCSEDEYDSFSPLIDPASSLVGLEKATRRSATFVYKGTVNVNGENILFVFKVISNKNF